MFEHLDDHNPGRTGTGAQLAAVRNRAREITSQRRRRHLAVGSVTVAATASVSAVAVLATTGGLGRATGQVGAGGSGTAAKSGSAAAPGKAAKSGTKAGMPSRNLPGSGKPGAPASGDGRGTCAASDAVSSETPPAGYVVNAAPGSQDPVLPFHRADGKSATVNLKIICAAIPVADRTSTSEHPVTALKVNGRDGYLWHLGASEAGVEWTAADGTSVFVVADGASGVRLTDAELEAYAASLPAT